MRDVAPVSLLTGLAGAAVVDGLTLLERLLGLKTQTPWGIAADIFLRPVTAHTMGGVILGVIGSIALSVALALAIYLFLRLSGRDYAPLKGVLAAEALGFVTMGVLAPLLHIAPGLKGDLTTNYVALVNLAVLGLAEGYLIAGMLRKEKSGTV